jgi:hypothetical protein
MAGRPEIDTNRVFLYGSSAEVGYVYELLSEQPALWKGAVLFHPGGFPDLAGVKLASVFVDAGDLEVEGVKVTAQFQEEALRAGVRVSFVVHAHSGHILQSIAAERERAQQLAKFVADN